MRRIVALALASLFVFQSAAAAFPRPVQDGAQEEVAPLTNKDVVTMVKAKVPPDVIVAKIESSRCHFDTSPSILAELRYNGTPDSVLMAMVKAPYGAPKKELAWKSPAASPKQSAAAEPGAPAVAVKLPAGTPLEVESIYSVNSGEVNEGSAISFRVVQPVKVDGRTVIAAGARATARVSKAKKGGSWGKAGQLAFAMQEVTAIDGGKIPLEFAQSSKGDSKGGTVATGMIVTGLLFLPAAPLWGFKKGKNAILPAGRRFEVVTHGEATVGAPEEPAR